MVSFVACLLLIGSVTADISLENEFIRFSMDDSATMNFGNPTFFGRPQGANLLSRTATPLWAAQVVTKNSAVPIDISPATPCQSRTASLPSPAVSLQWIGLQVDGQPSLNVQLNLTLQQSSVHLQLAFEMTGQVSLWNWNLAAGFFSLPSSSALVLNEGFGVVQNCSRTGGCASFSGSYSSLTFQFLAAYGLAGGAGVYVGAHDPQGAAKQFRADVQSSAVTFHVSATPPGAGLSTSRSTVIDYPIVIALFDGDWYDAAMIYREWVLPSASWTVRGPLVNRTDFPKWLPQITTWVNSHWQENDIFNITGGDPTVVLNRVTRSVQRFGLERDALALHWYEWDLLGYAYGSNYSNCTTEVTCGFDTHYPEYFPPRENFQASLQQLQQLGVRVTPYINGRIFDQATQTWKQDSAIDFASKSALPQLDSKNLSLYDEQYGSKAVFAVMCPFTKYWQQTIAGVVDLLVNKYGTDGVYIDQIAAAGPKNCFDPTHNHPIGGGAHWVEGYRAMLQNARGRAGSQALLLTESNSEPYMDGVDLYLTLVAFNAPFAGDTHSVPLFQAVYGGYVFLGGAMFFQEDFTPPDVFAAKIARQFVFGAQMGWFSLGGRDNQKPPMGLIDYLMDNKFTPEIDFLRQLSAAKRVAIPYLVYGRALRALPIVIANDVPKTFRVPSSTNIQDIHEGQRSMFSLVKENEYNAVESAAWQGTNSSLLLLFASTQRSNSDNNGDITVSCDIDVRNYGFPSQDPSSKATLTRVFPDYAEIGTFACTQVKVSMQLQARGVLMYRVSL